MPPPVTSSSGPTPSSASSVAGGLSGGLESTDQGPARNTYSMQVYGTPFYSCNLGLDYFVTSVNSACKLCAYFPQCVIMVMCAYCRCP
jgi:hypothetical protein